MATYRNSFSNYYSDKTGNHAPVGTILPVFADVNLGAEEADYAYPQHLYCDGKELLIRDYPELYSIIENTYGGSESVEKTQAAQPGGLRRSYFVNNKLFFQFYHDATNNKANVKLPYPYESVLRFSTDPNQNVFGSFPSNGIFNQSTFYSLIQPSEDVSAFEQPNEFAYEVVFPDSVDLTTVNQADYTKNFVTGGGFNNFSLNVTNNGQTAWTINGNDRNGAVSGDNPTLNFADGDIIQFNVTTDSDHPFLIKTVNGSGDGNQLPEKVPSLAYGVNGNGVGRDAGGSPGGSGIVTLYTNTLNGIYPNLYYNCENHAVMNGLIVTGPSSGSASTHPVIIIQRSFNFRDYPYNVGTFNLPDYRNRKILGYGTVNGPGTSTPENAVNNFVGQTGGQWYIAQNTLIDSGEFFAIGDVKTTGYANITADISAYITGSVSYQIGPMDDYVFPFPPAHNHRILSVEVDETKRAELGAIEVDKYAVNYINSRANLNVFEPNGSAGGALGHSHGLIGRALQNSLTATYGNTNGIGETAGDTGDAQYQYLVSEAADINVTSMTYDSNTGYITINTDGAHGLSVDDIVSVNGAAPAEYSGSFTIIANGFGSTSFNVLPRTGEIPTQTPATGTITVKLASGYFAETEVLDPPRAYVVDANTKVGGKVSEFEIPGNAITIQETTIDIPNTAQNITIPAASLGIVSGMYIELQAPGGGGADSDNDGTDGGQSKVSFFHDGSFYEIIALGGGGGTAGNSGGAGGAGGGVLVLKDGAPDNLSDITGASIEVIQGIAGGNGGYTGNGSNDSQATIAFGGGGNGTAQQKGQTINEPPQTFTTNGSYQIPAPLLTETSREIIVELSGGGGGPGNPNSGSNCSSTWPGFPTSTSGKTGANGGYGARGTLLVCSGNFTSGTFNWELGEGGDAGWNVKQGNSQGGTPGIDPRTGQPYNNWVGGFGTGVEPYGDTPRKAGAAGSLSGRGARGAWGNGGTGGSGGGVTGLFLDGVAIAGAAGGGGGGGSGGGNNGGSTTDGCYAGDPGVGPAQSLAAFSSAIDFYNGGNGAPGGCTAGGGGGGGASCGVQAGIGGSGGTAGIGHNGNGGGGGGATGVSAYRSDRWSGGVTEFIEGGSLPTIGGFVKITLNRDTIFYEDVGGAGGSGGKVTVILPGVNTGVAANLQGLGQGGGTASDALSAPNGGQLYVRYYGREQGSTETGDPTVPTGVFYECDQNGVPQGASFSGNVWLSSTDDDIRERQFGAGTGDDTGFSGGTTAIPFNSGGEITKYIPFTGAAAEAGGKRQLEVGPFDTTNVNQMRFTVIRGSNTNGGENPDQALNVFFRKGTSSSVTLLNSVLLATSSPESPWEVSTIPVPENARDATVTFILEQDRGPSYLVDPESDDNYGLGAITLFYLPRTVSTFVSTGGATLLGNLDVGSQPINSDEGIDQVRREVSASAAAMTVTDGVFTMSSSTPITTTATVIAENNIPLITKYHRVKYLIKAL